MKLLLALLLPVAIVPAPPTEQVVIADGHVDLGPRFVDGKWTIQLRDDTGDPVVWRPLENVVVQANDAAVVSVPSDPSYAFLGTPGAKVWVIPQVQQAGVVWPGWNTQDPEVASRVDREVTWSLNGVDGPGVFTLFLNSDFGKPAPVFDSRKPYPQETGIDVNTHVHGNWTFSTPGTYLLDITMTAHLTDGSTVTDTRPLRLHAGPGKPKEAFKTSAPAGAGDAAGEQAAGSGREGGGEGGRAERRAGRSCPRAPLALARRHRRSPRRPRRDLRHPPPEARMSAAGSNPARSHPTNSPAGAARSASAAGGVGSGGAVLQVAGVGVELAGRRVLYDVDLVVGGGEQVGLIGPNGAGKTTLLRAVLGLAPTSGGVVAVDGRTPREARGFVGYVPQRHEFVWDYPVDVRTAVMTGRTHRIGWLRRPGADDRAAVAEALGRVDLTDLQRRPIGELSGGQRQRVLVARALALRPSLLLLDEPFTGLDVPTQEILTRLFRELTAEGTAILMTTHDLPAAADTCSRLCLLNETVIADGSPDELRDPAVWLRAFGVARSEQLLHTLGVAR